MVSKDIDVLNSLFSFFKDQCDPFLRLNTTSKKLTFTKILLKPLPLKAWISLFILLSGFWLMYWLCWELYVLRLYSNPVLPCLLYPVKWILQDIKFSFIVDAHRHIKAVTVFFPSFCSKWNSNNFRLCLMIRIFSTLLLVWFKANEIALSSVSSGVGGKKYFIFNCKNLLLHDIISKIVQDVISKDTMGLYRDDGLIVLNKVNSQKITHMWGRHLLMNLKNKYLLKSCWSGLIKIKITFL